MQRACGVRVTMTLRWLYVSAYYTHTHTHTHTHSVRVAYGRMTLMWPFDAASSFMPDVDGVCLKNKFKIYKYKSSQCRT